MKRFLFGLVCLAVFSISGVVQAETGGTWNFRLDNDSLAIPHTDQNYTMGVAITYTTKANTSWVDNNLLRPFLDGINNIVPFGPDLKLSGQYFREREFILQDDAFSPQCLHTASVCAAEGHPIDHDRPYANLIWTGIAIYNSDHDQKHERAVRSEFDVGVYGTSIGRVVQTHIHQRCCVDNIPQEWDTQIGDGGSLTFLYKQAHFYSLTEHNFPVELKLNYGYWFGWNIWPTAGISAKCCVPGSEWDRVRLEYDASYVIYNESLQGAWSGKNQITYSYDQMEPIVTLMHFKLDIIKPDEKKEGFRFAYSQNWKSKELKDSLVEPKHRWGGLELAYIKPL